MKHSLAPYLVALLGIAGIAWLTCAFLPVLGLASAALLFLLPVLYAAARGGVGPGLMAAVLGAAAYNFFLLPPRFTLRVHGLDNLVSVIVLVAVAIVTSRLATRLKAREQEALAQAGMSAELAELSATLASHPAASALERGVALIAGQHGDVRLLEEAQLTQDNAAFSSLDLSAAAWSIHNGDRTGHGTGIMPAADWTFLPLAGRKRHEGTLAAIARPADGSVRTARQLDHLQQLCLLLGQFRDRDALEAARREREALAESDRLRRTMLAALAHDFRTPLTVVTGRLALLAERDADAAEALAAARRLNRTMSDLLGAARMETGVLAPAREDIDLVDEVSACCEGLVLPPGVALKRAIPADLPFVKADPVLLHHVLGNLVDNGLRHAASRVTIAAHHDDGCVLLSVCDDGPGIPEADQARIFDRFARLEGNDRTSGSGLGLAIAKGFAEAMGMTLGVRTASGGGAEFTLAIPVGAIPVGAIPVGSMPDGTMPDGSPPIGERPCP